MSLPNLISQSCILAAAGLGLLLASCSTASVGNGATITKVNPYHLTDVNARVVAADPSIQFEKDSILHGAISMTERVARQGDYFTIFWKVEDRSQPVVVRLEYRQKNSGLTIKKLEQEVTEVGRNNVTKFSLIGDDYISNAHVTSWRASILRGNQVLTSYNSYLWE
ncbi:MAG: hypothetical protein ACAI34_04185 [Verrucomicrobium sp.]|nr:hypothetical protein [Verrucomicrobium sp.]